MSGLNVEKRLSGLEGRVKALEGGDRLVVGSFAKVVERGTSGHGYGTIVKIIEDDRTRMPYLAECSNGGQLWHREKDLVKIDATDFDDYADLFDEFKEGDKVTLISGGGEYPLNGFYNGQDYEVKATNHAHSLGKRIQLTRANGRVGYALPRQLVLVEGLKERMMAELESVVKDVRKGSMEVTDLERGFALGSQQEMTFTVRRK